MAPPASIKVEFERSGAWLWARVLAWEPGRLALRPHHHYPDFIPAIGDRCQRRGQIYQVVTIEAGVLICEEVGP